MTSRDRKGFLHSTVAASTSASVEDKQRARKAQHALRNDREYPERCFVYNGFLNLIARGAAPTEKNILEESSKIAKANAEHFAANAEKRKQQRAAA